MGLFELIDQTVESFNWPAKFKEEVKLDLVLVILTTFLARVGGEQKINPLNKKVNLAQPEDLAAKFMENSQNRQLLNQVSQEILIDWLKNIATKMSGKNKKIALDLLAQFESA